MLSRVEQRKGRELSPDEILKHRFAALGYYDSSDDGGGGSALDSITAAAASLGSAYIVSQNQPQYTQVPTRTNPAYGAATPFFSSGGSTGMGGFFLVGVLAFVAFVAYAVTR